MQHTMNGLQRPPSSSPAQRLAPPVHHTPAPAPVLGACTSASRRTRRRVEARVFPFLNQSKGDTPPAPAAAAPPSQAPASSATHQSAAGYKFQLPLAVSLAGAAFEAYFEPTGAEGFQEVGQNGTETTFTDSDFLADVCEGVLHVELLSAKGLRVADVTGSSDPYAVVSVGPSTAKSKVVYRSLEPSWNQSFFLYVRSFMTDLLQVRLYDEDLLKSDDDLGLARVALANLTRGQASTLTLPLMGPGGQGEVTVRLTPLLFSEHMLDVLTSDGTAVPTAEGPKPVESKRVQQQLLKAAAQETASQPTLPDVNALKDTLSRALERVGMLGNQAGQVTQEEVAANPWKVLARMAGCTRSHSWVPVAYVDNKESETQVWIYRSKESREVVISFRGTEQIKWKDLATDVNLVPCTLNVERVDDNAGKPLALRLIQAAMPTDEMMVHSGFLSAYDSVKPQVFKLLDSITNPKDNDPDHLGTWQVFVTGHSLGGALATLCAYELASRRGPARERQTVAMYTFGAPRVGNKKFAERFDQLVPDSWRVTNSNDIIPSVPRLLGYAHVKHSVRLSDGGKLTIQDDAGVDVFGEGKAGLDVIQEITNKVQTNEKTWDEVYEQIKSSELAILDNLVNGKALEEHMEDYYLDTLKQVVLASAGTAAATEAPKQ